jgi:release factor glutamine methyltransferase
MPSATPEQGPWTVARLLGWTRDYLAQQGVESPRLCSEILLAHAMNCERLHLFTQYERVPEAPILDRFRADVREAVKGRPIAYITGTKEFFALTFRVTPEVLIPRPETEILVERAISLVRHEQAGGRILDLCTGSGCVAVAIAKNLPEAEVFASDLSEAALAIARENAAAHAVDQRIEFVPGDLLEPWLSEPPFDIVVCNPPYIATAQRDSLSATVRDFEPQDALFAGEDGLSLIRRLLTELPPRLMPDGHLLFEMAYDQADAVAELSAQHGWLGYQTYRDAGDHQRVVHVRAAAHSQPDPVSST